MKSLNGKKRFSLGSVETLTHSLFSGIEHKLYQAVELRARTKPKELEPIIKSLYNRILDPINSITSNIL